MGSGANSKFTSVVNNGDYYLNLAKDKDLYGDEHEVKEALTAYKQAIIFFTGIKTLSLEQKKSLIEAYQGIGNIYSQKLFNFESAIEYYQKAKELCNPREDFSQILEIEKILSELENLDERKNDEQGNYQTAPQLPKEFVDEITDACRKGIDKEIEYFLKDVKEILKSNNLVIEPLLISYVPEKNQGLAILVAIHDLAMYLSQVGINVVLDPLTTSELLEEKLKDYERVMIFCTPLYAKAVTNEPKIKKVLESFVERVQSKKGKLYTTLYTLLCDGGFADTAIKVVDSQYLIRSYQKVVNPKAIKPPIDIIESMRIFIDIFAHFSGNQGLGILPDLLSLTSRDTEQKTYEDYKLMFNKFEQKVQRINFDYILKINLLSVAEINVLKSYFNAELPALSKVSTSVNELLNNPQVKTGLLFCPTVADTILVGLAVEKELTKQQKVRVLSINCADYRGKAAHDCVELFLKKLKFTTHEINELKQANNILIIFKNYEQLGVYDNLYVRNQLDKWNNVKVLVTCVSDFFQHRSFYNCFLSDPINPDLNSLSYNYIEHFAPPEAQKERVYMGKRKKVEAEDNRDFFGIKRHAQQKELSDFLRNLNAIFIGQKFLQNDRHVFISYAWEDTKTEGGKALARQQHYLRCIANDLITLGFPTWLDVERMTGDINSQMVININNSRYVLLIGTNRYKERANQETNVKKEYDTVLARANDDKLTITILPVKFASQDEKDIFPETLLSLYNYKNQLDFSSMDDGDNYIKSLTCISDDFNGLIPRLLDLKSSTKTHVLSEYRKCLDDFHKRLSLLPAKHLLTDKGQYDVQAYDIDNRLKAYIKPYGLKKVTDELKERFGLQKHFNEFLNSPVKTYVVLGRAGAGKSLFALSTFKEKLKDWHDYRKDGDSYFSSPPTWLPIYIPLKNYDFANKDKQQISKYIEDILQKDYHLNQKDIDSLKEGLGVKQGILFILDGYDELGKGVYPNFAKILANWQYAKFLVAGRPEHFDSTSQHATAFALLKEDSEERDHQTFNISYVSQFSDQDIKNYIEEYRKVNPDDNLKEDTYGTLNSIPGLMALLDNPFVLHLVLQSIKQILKNRQQNSTVSRFDVYNAFAEYWFTKRASHRNITKETCQEFAESLACRLFQEKTIYITPNKIKLWQEFFINPKKSTERECCPLRRSGNEYSFIHKSVYEYFIAARLWKELTNKQQKINSKMSWNYQLLTEEIAVIEFIREMYKAEKIHNPQNLDFIKTRLFEMINMSKSNKIWTITAANAITMLPLLEGRDCLVGHDFSKVKISGATLENVNLSKVKFKNAILQNVNLGCSNLDEANLTKADLTGAFFGEYAPLTGHTAAITNVATLDDGKQIVTSSLDATIKIWDIDSGKQLETLNNHTDAIFCMAITYKGEKIITGSFDTTCRIWHKTPLTSFKEQFCLKGHTDAIHSLTITPNSTYLATGSYDHTCRVWNITTGQPIACLEEHTATINNLLTTYDNKLLITTSYDQTCRLWGLSQLPNQKKSLSTLNHQAIIHCLALTIDNNYLVTGDENGYCHIWRISFFSFIEIYHLKPHTKQISTILITPDQKYFISSSHDNTYNLTKMKTKESTPPTTAHTTEITTAHTTSESKRLITTSHSGEIKIWDVDTQKPLASFAGHQDSIYSAAITPDNKKVITGSADTTCRLWDIAVSDKVSLQRDTTDHHQLSATNIIINNTKLSDSNRRLLLFKRVKAIHPYGVHEPPSILDYKDTHSSQRLTELVGRGEQDRAEDRIKNMAQLALIKTTLVDCTGRSYHNISALQYAVWALDYHMWKMILKHLENANLQLEVRAQLEELNHIATLNEEGWAIKPETNIDWPSLSWAPLIKALDKYLKDYNKNIWCQQVGSAQLILPAHLINEYSHPSRPFYPCPTWGDSEASLPRTRVSDWREVDNGQYILAKDFAWCRAGWRRSSGTGDNKGMHYGARYDRTALNELLRARVEQARIMLESKLLSKPYSPLSLTM